MLLSTEGVPEERYGEEIHVAVRSDRTLADDGKRLSGDGRYTNVAKRFQRRGPERRYMSRLRPSGPWRIARKSYIYIRKLNFLGSLFWRGFGEILERFWREILETKSSKHNVFYDGF